LIWLNETYQPPPEICISTLFYQVFVAFRKSWTTASTTPRQFMIPDLTLIDDNHDDQENAQFPFSYIGKWESRKG
jgi:hypothetical protein